MLPYIGVTGVTDLAQAHALLGALPPNSGRTLMVGGLMSFKTMRGGANKWPKRYLPAEAIAGIFPKDTRALNLIHYNTKEEGVSLAEQLCEAMRVGGAHCHGMQLNIAWPDPAQIGSFRLTYPDAVIVIQVGARAFERAGNDPLGLVRLVADYRDAIDFVLLDPSGGLGKPFDPAALRVYLQALRAARLPVKCGVAGDLSPATLGLLEPLAGDFPDLCTDAEGKLRDAADELDVAAAAAYVAGVAALFG